MAAPESDLARVGTTQDKPVSVSRNTAPTTVSYICHTTALGDDRRGPQSRGFRRPA